MKQITLYTIQEWRKTHKNDLNEPMEFKEKKILHLTLKKKWFDMILSGEKKEEYREVKSYWITRLLCDFSWDINKNSVKINKDKLVINKGSYKQQEFDFIVFKNGYSKNAPSFIIECTSISIGTAKPEWSDNWQGDVFVLKLGEII